MKGRKESTRPRSRMALDRPGFDQVSGRRHQAGRLEGRPRAGLVGLRFPHRAQSGRSLPGREAGGNCYNCHQLAEDRTGGTLGPSLTNYGKLRGASEDMLKYTYDVIYNAHAYFACTSMPRIGRQRCVEPAADRRRDGLPVRPASPGQQVGGSTPAGRSGGGHIKSHRRQRRWLFSSGNPGRCRRGRRFEWNLRRAGKFLRPACPAQ
jgi:hypothetical protein